MRFIKFLAVAGILLMVGCDQPTIEQRRQNAADDFTRERLPKSAKNVQWLEKGSYEGWGTFEMDVAGRKRKFLLGWWYGSHGEVGRTVTELRDE